MEKETLNRTHKEYHNEYAHQALTLNSIMMGMGVSWDDVLPSKLRSSKTKKYLAPKGSYEVIEPQKLHTFTFNRNGKKYEIEAIDKKRALKKLDKLIKK